MKKTFHPYPSIKQFRHALKYLKAPTVFKGSVKLHGTNGAIVFTRDPVGAFQVSFQSRNQVLTADAIDNHGFRAAMAAMPDMTDWLITRISHISNDMNVVVVYGEWCGPKINSNVAVNQLDHFFYIFDISLDGVFMTADHFSLLDFRYNNVWTKNAFPSYRVTVDPASPGQTTLEAYLLEKTLEVENACPVAHKIAAWYGKTLQNTTGEGIVWTSADGNIRFKTKGAKHQRSDKAFRATVIRYDRGDMDNLLDDIVPEWRLEQMAIGDWDLRNIGSYLCRLAADVKKEESDTIDQFLADNAAATQKDVMRGVSHRGSKFFKSKLI